MRWHERDFIQKMALPEGWALFVYNGRSSHEFDLIVSAETPFLSPERVVDKYEIDGRSGVLTIDRGRYKNLALPVAVYLAGKGPLQKQAYRVSNWLKTGVGFKELYLSWDPQYIHTAMLNVSFETEQRLADLGQATLTFDCHPIKLRRDGLFARPVAQGQALHNPERLEAEPDIVIDGEGNVDLYFTAQDAQQVLSFRDLSGPVTVECGRKIVYDANGMGAYGKVTSRALPVLPVGEVVISWTGKVHKLEITPRWGGLLP